MRQYLDPLFTSQATHVPDETYGMILDHIVVCCVDCLIVFGGQLLLGRRAQHPYRGWWVMGGRMKPGESYEMTARRVVEREVGLQIDDLARFSYIDTACYSWKLREQEPHDHGCHMEGNNFFVHISEDEAARVRHEGDFSELQWVAPKQIIGNDAYHPSIQFFAQFLQGLLTRDG